MQQLVNRQDSKQVFRTYLGCVCVCEQIVSALMGD